MLIRVHTRYIRTNLVPARRILSQQRFIKLIVCYISIENNIASAADAIANCKAALHGVKLSYTFIRLYDDIYGKLYRMTVYAVRISPNRPSGTIRRTRCRSFALHIIRTRSIHPPNYIAPIL